MNRRAYIASIAVALGGSGGCLSSRFPADQGGSDEGDGTITSRGDGESPLEPSIEVVRSEVTSDTPALVELAVTNTGWSKGEYLSGLPRPFGALFADDTVLWTDDYERSSCVQTEGKRVTGGCDAGARVILDPGETRSETYEFNGDPGTYTVNQTGNPFEIDGVSYTITFTVE